jgi:MAE_28990/MAE_18760-like HEPN
MNSLELQKNLDGLSSWRKKELSLARGLAEKEQNEEIKKYLCRAWTLILYAHCDNFLKEASKYYLTYLEGTPLKNYKADAVWLMFRGKDSVTNAADTKYLKPSSLEKNFQLHFSAIRSDAVMEERSFSYKTLRFFCDWVLQIQFSYDTKKTFCKTLVKKRNAIAHGQEEYIDNEDCIKWHEATIAFMDELKDAIMASL